MLKCVWGGGGGGGGGRGGRAGREENVNMAQVAGRCCRERCHTQYTVDNENSSGGLKGAIGSLRPRRQAGFQPKITVE